MGFKTKSTPAGSIETSLSVMELALTAGATFVAQSFSSDLKELTSLIEKGIEHKGFSLINVFSPCVTFNKINTYDWFKENLVSLGTIEDYNPNNRISAMNTLMEYNGLVTGLIYQDLEKPSYEDLVHGFKEEGLAKQNIQLEQDQFEDLVAEFK